jgi:RNA polymerase sigma-70 factor (ECF subfamily)
MTNETGGDGVILGMHNGLMAGIRLTEPVSGAEDHDAAEVFRQLSSRHIVAAYRLALAILGDQLEAEDASQDAFTSAWRQRASLRDADKFEAWFTRILVNVCRDRLRRKTRARHIVNEMAPEPVADPARAALDRDALGRALSALDPDMRIVVILRFWMDLTVDDIAERLGIPAGTVKSRLHSSMRQLRPAVEELG